MSMIPRIGVLTLVLVAMSFTPTAQASGCVDVEYRSFGSGLHVIANTGRELAFGFASGYPGDGVGAVAVITPSLCGGVGVGIVGQDPNDLLRDTANTGQSTLDGALLLLPLP